MSTPTALSAVLLLSAVLSGCTPLVVGVAGTVAADALIEEERGGDGLF